MSVSKLLLLSSREGRPHVCQAERDCVRDRRMIVSGQAYVADELANGVRVLADDIVLANRERVIVQASGGHQQAPGSSHG
jgi:hypothetical protein